MMGLKLTLKHEGLNSESLNRSFEVSSLQKKQSKLRVECEDSSLINCLSSVD